MSGNKFDSYVLHIEQSTLDKLNGTRELLIENRGRAYDFDLIIRKALGRYLTALKYEAKQKCS